MTCSSCNKNTTSNQLYVNKYQPYVPMNRKHTDFAHNPVPNTQWVTNGGQKTTYSADINVTTDRKNLENMYGINTHAKGNEKEEKSIKSNNKLQNKKK